ncbi:GNAT family N-acetyltransferase [Rhizobium sp. SSA_523]|uniref:GNAT family N-acetyltransferase n=1 Tax=Rhizobium sp. SSA_523 TaxID=2952477 RepID=UPI002091AE90|nr:GNAT family N-acetyltransferase [Rhizobium sp. SSA_523]MCO5730442.1 GNAT family N-acetyltransferase [Rhizobium sp. SSA_523]WKC25485.1 GNAT family N-acetyltransferase [Rhizobium sp. SSA_523]
MNYTVSVTDNLTPEEQKAIEAPLIAYNLETFGQSGKRDLHIALRNDAGQVEGGLVGYTARGWLYVQLLFIPAHARGKGLGARLLLMAEDEARARGCLGAYLDTMNPSALDLYLRCGYTRIGEHGPLRGSLSRQGPDGGDCEQALRITWLSKRFTTGDEE